jgi:uncharacterized protein YycO
MQDRISILLFKGKGLISSLVRWQTRSEYAHAAILFPDGVTLVESWPFVGVRIKKITDWSNITVFDIPSANSLQLDGALKFAISQAGKKYAWLDIMRFITRTKGDQQDSWFCSELVFASFQKAGINLLERIKANAVSPELLSVSPLLVERA